jgi:hypothetical protein
LPLYSDTQRCEPVRSTSLCTHGEVLPESHSNHLDRTLLTRLEPQPPTRGAALDIPVLRFAVVLAVIVVIAGRFKAPSTRPSSRAASWGEAGRSGDSRRRRGRRAFRCCTTTPTTTGSPGSPISQPNGSHRAARSMIKLPSARVAHTQVHSIDQSQRESVRYDSVRRSPTSGRGVHAGERRDWGHVGLPSRGSACVPTPPGSPVADRVRARRALYQSRKCRPAPTGRDDLAASRQAPRA